MNNQLVKQKSFINKLNGIRGLSKKKIKTFRAISYGRVSTKEQAKKELSISEIQIPESKKLIKEYNWKFVKSYTDAGFSGNTFSKRPALQKMLNEDINTYDVIVIYSFDRLVRDDSYVEAEIYKILDKHKIQVTSVLQNVQIIDPDKYDPKSLNVSTQRKFRSMQVSYDSLTRRERFMHSRVKTVERGKHIVAAPYGYKVVREVDPKDPRRTVGYRMPDKQEAPVLKRIFKERALKGKTYREIAISLNESGIKNRGGKEWSKGTIRLILMNPFHCGYIIWNKTQDRKSGDGRVIKTMPESEWKFIEVNKKLEKYYKTLINKEMYLRVQRLRKKDSKVRRRGNTSNMLAGLIRCPLCNGPMIETSFYRIKRPPYKRSYYVCSGHMNKGLCSKKKYPAYPIKTRVKKKTETFLNNPQVFKEYLEQEDKGKIPEKEKSLKREKRVWEKAEEDVKSLNLKYLRNKIKEKYYTILLPELEKKEEQAKESYLSLKQDIQELYQTKEEKRSLMSLSIEIKGRFRNLTARQLNLIFSALIETIVPAKKMKGRGVRGDPRDNIPTLIWNSPAVMELECSFQTQQQYDEYQ